MQKYAKKFAYIKKLYYLCTRFQKQTNQRWRQHHKNGNKIMKTIRNNQAVRLSNWNENSAHEAAMIHDMGLNPDYAEYVTDENRLYASARPSFLTNDPDWYASEDEAYKNIITLEDGELVKLASNGKTYRVKAMRKRFEYLTDILHFTLVA